MSVGGCLFVCVIRIFVLQAQLILRKSSKG